MALVAFLQTHPELQGRPFYIAGEACHPLRLPLPPPRLVTAITCEWPQSYGGHYVPNLAKAIQTHNAAATTPVSLRIALKGIAGAVQPTATLASSHVGGSRATRCFVSKRFALGSRERNHWWGRSVDLRSGQWLRRLAARLQHERAVRKVRSQRHRRRPTQPTRNLWVSSRPRMLRWSRTRTLRGRPALAHDARGLSLPWDGSACGR